MRDSGGAFWIIIAHRHLASMEVMHWNLSSHHRFTIDIYICSVFYVYVDYGDEVTEQLDRHIPVFILEPDGRRA